MTDQTITLAGQSWEIPSLPWGAVRKIQPTLLSIADAAGGQGINTRTVSLLPEGELEKLGRCVLIAIRHTTNETPVPSEKEFDAMPITVAEMISAMPAVARAVGLRAREGGQSDEGKPESIGTNS